MTTANVNGIEIFYRDVGEGFPVILVPGYTGTSRSWALAAPALVGRFRVISVDLRGRDQSDARAREVAGASGLAAAFLAMTGEEALPG